MSLTAPQRRACRILAEKDWEATRLAREPHWQKLTDAQRAVLVAECERFIGRYEALLGEARAAAA